MGVSGCVVDMDRSAVSRGPLIATSLQQLVRGPMLGVPNASTPQCLKQFNHFLIEIWINISRLSGGPYPLGAPGTCLPRCVVSGCLVTCLRSCVSLAPCLEVVDGS